jgi:formylmethanofuran dehydrogenase subunit D
MNVLTLTHDGQLTLSTDDMRHLGISPGDAVEVQKLPGGHIALRARRGGQPIDRLFGILANKTSKVATLEEIQSACEAGWSGQVSAE